MEQKIVFDEANPKSTAESVELGETKNVAVDAEGNAALQLLAQVGPVDYTEEEAARVRWKIDMFFLPIVSHHFAVYEPY